MKVWKDIRVIILLILIISSLFLVGIPLIIKRSGVVVTSVDPNAKCSAIYVDSIITQTVGGIVNNVDDFVKTTSSVKSGSYVTMLVDNGPGGCTAIADGDVGIKIENVKSTFLKMSPDIQGSVKNIYNLIGNFLATDVNSSEIIINQRADVLNLQYTKVGIEGDNITITNNLYDNIDNLISPCQLTGKVITNLNLENWVGKVKFGNESYDAQFNESFVDLNGLIYQLNQKIFFSSMKIEFSNVTNSSVVETVYFFNNSDVVSVLGSSTINTDTSSGQNYFNIPITPSTNSVEILKNIVRNLGTTVSGGQVVMNGKMEFGLDGVILSDLPIPYTLATQPITSLSIIGVGLSRNYVSNLNDKTFMCLKSTPLNFQLEKTGSISIQPTNKNLFLYVILASVLLPFVISLTMFVKSKSVKEFILLIVLSQIIVTFGIAMFTQFIFKPVGWIIDMQTIFGLLASVVIVQITVRFNKTFSRIKRLKYLDWIVFMVGFMILFTPFKGFGLSLFLGLLLKMVIYQPVSDVWLK